MSTKGVPREGWAVFDGPFASTTEPFSLLNRHGATLRGTVSRTRRGDYPGGDGAPQVVVVVAGLGRTRQWTVLSGLQLLLNGFTVIRFDLTNSVGLSDGDILDFTLTRACEDLCDVALWARSRFASERVSALAASVTGRAALRAAALHPDLFRLVGTLCGVVDTRATLTALLRGTDLVAQFRDGTLHDTDGVRTLFGHEIRLDGVGSLVLDDWAGISGTIHDLRSADSTRFLGFHGERDAWICATDVRTVFQSVPHARSCVLDEAGHELNHAQTRQVLGELIRVHWAISGRTTRDAATGKPRVAPWEPTVEQLSAQRRMEKKLDRWWRAQLPAPVGAPVTEPRRRRAETSERTRGSWSATAP
ncbi:hypothetical protein [Streptomyces oceani]|uniref:hypothetical protein n=1 Tax=Streptomyces oceani TaxID=1075402 RepID=UPI000871DC16|nr:hypothetical protein [Streptomyces oceani]